MSVGFAFWDESWRDSFPEQVLTALLCAKRGIRELPWNHGAILLVFLSKPARRGSCSSLNQRMMTSREKGREGRSQMLLHGQTEHQQRMKTRHNANINLFLHIYQTYSCKMVSVTSVQCNSLNNFNFLKFLKITLCFYGNRNGVIFIPAIAPKYLLTELILENNLPQWTFQSAFLFLLIFIPMQLLRSNFFFLSIFLFTGKKLCLQTQTTKYNRGNVLFKLLCLLCIHYLTACLTLSTTFYVF